MGNLLTWPSILVNGISLEENNPVVCYTICFCNWFFWLPIALWNLMSFSISPVQNCLSGWRVPTCEWNGKHDTCFSAYLAFSQMWVKGRKVVSVGERSQYTEIAVKILDHLKSFWHGLLSNFCTKLPSAFLERFNKLQMDSTGINNEQSAIATVCTCSY